MRLQKNQSWIIDLFGLTTLFIGFYLCWLGSYPLFTPDEARYSEVAREMLATGNFITPNVNGIPFLDKPILYYWLQALSMHFFGVNEWAIRLAPALCGVFGCVMTYVCGRKLFDRKTGLIAATILATSPLYFGAAHYANLDLEVATWIGSSLLCILTGLTSRHPRPWMLLAYFFAALAVLTKGLIGLAFPIMITGIWITLLWRWDLLKKASLLTGLIGMAILVLPWYLAVQHANPDFFNYFFVTQQFSRFMSHGEFNNKNVFWFYVPVIFAGLFPWALLVPAAFTSAVKGIWQRRHDHAVELFLLVWTISIFVFFSIPHSKLAGYILPVFMPLALLTARYIASLWQTSRATAVFATSTAIVVACVIMGVVFGTLPRFEHSYLIQNAKPLLVALANFVTVGGILLLVCLQHVNMKRLFAFCTLLSGIMMLIIVGNAQTINHDSTKHLVTVLKQQIKPADHVANYFKFNQDVPIYLGRTIELVADWQAPDIDQHDNWLREMWLGRHAPASDKILIQENRFWDNWHAKNRLFVFVKDNYMAQFKQHTNHYHVIAHDNDVYLLSNQAA